MMARSLMVAMFAILCVPTVATAQTQYNVTLQDAQIVPATMSATAGTPVSISVRNAGKQTHNLVIPDFFIFTSNLKPGERTDVRFTPDKKGTFPYYSDTGGKPEAGMRGTINVR